MKKTISLIILSIIIIFIFIKCRYRDDFIIVNEIKLNENVKVAVVKNTKAEFSLVKFTDNKYDYIPTNMQLEKNANYELDSLKIDGNNTIIELFYMDEGIDESTGFLFSYDYNKNFKYIDISAIDSIEAEDIEKIQIDSKNKKINVSLFSSSPKRHFTSVDSCRTWQLDSTWHR